MRRTTDLPAQQSPRVERDLSSEATRYAGIVRVSYLACIALATLTGLGFDPSFAHAGDRLVRALAPPLTSRDLVDAARNIALFFGWGAIFALTARAPTRWRHVAQAVLWGLAASLTVETCQLFSQYRQASIVDVATNTLGSLLGAAVLWAIEWRASGDMRGGTLIGVPGWLPAGALLLTAHALSFAPSSRPTPRLVWGPSPLERLREIAAGPATVVPWSALPPDAAAWFAAGLAVAVAIRDRTGAVRAGQALAWLVIAPGMLVAAIVLRAAAGLQREARAWELDFAAMALGLLIGLIGIPIWRRRFSARATRALHLFLVICAVGAIMSWTPASWVVARGQPIAMSWRALVPMLSLFERQDLSSVFIVLQKASLGAALGACLAARARMGAPVPGAWVAIAVACLLEVGQLLVPGRYPDMTDILITASAAGLAIVVIARSDPARVDLTPSPAPDLNGRGGTGRF